VGYEARLTVCIDGVLTEAVKCVVALRIVWVAVMSREGRQREGGAAEGLQTVYMYTDCTGGRLAAGRLVGLDWLCFVELGTEDV
jgi:hypothetical protein